MTNQDRATRLTRGEIKAFRKAQGWSAARLGIELGNGIVGNEYSRSYIKAIESGAMPISRFFRERFRITRARIIGEQAQSKNILVRGRLPKRLVIAGRIKKCVACGWHFVGVTPNQRFCGEACRAKSRKAVFAARGQRCERSRLQIKRAGLAKPQRR